MNNLTFQDTKDMQQLTKRQPCMCGVITKRLCISCFEINVCKTHKKCDSCKLQEFYDKSALLECSLVEQQKEERRKKARDAYRIKMGIPTDLPLLPRGGAHNCKNFTEEQLAEKAAASKIYQKDYQKKYREKKVTDALKKKTLELMAEYAVLITHLNMEGQDASVEQTAYKGFETYLQLLDK